MDLPPERQETLRAAMRRAVMNATRQAVRQVEHACNQLKVDPRTIVSPELVAVMAATPAVFGGACSS